MYKKVLPPDVAPGSAERIYMKFPRNLGAEQMELVQMFVQQIVLCHDPDAVSTFLSWRADPRLESILDLAAKMGDEEIDQLLFFAEDLSANS